METRWLYVTSEELSALRRASADTCLIPMGCVEKHGLHLPLGTDILEASRMAYLASQKETVCVFPDYIFGDVAWCWPNTPDGVVTLPMDTQFLLLEQLCYQIARNGFKKILVLNCHGGNRSWLEAFSRRLCNKKRDFVFGVVQPAVVDKPIRTMGKRLCEEGRGLYPLLTAEDEDVLMDFHRKNGKTGHACMAETAMIFATAPESVHLDRLGVESGQNTHAADHFKEAGIYIRDNGWDMNYVNWYDGDDPVGCNERIGQTAMDLAAEDVAHAVRVFKEDDTLLPWLEEKQKGW